MKTAMGQRIDMPDIGHCYSIMLPMPTFPSLISHIFYGSTALKLHYYNRASQTWLKGDG